MVEKFDNALNADLFRKYLEKNFNSINIDNFKKECEHINAPRNDEFFGAWPDYNEKESPRLYINIIIDSSLIRETIKYFSNEKESPSPYDISSSLIRKIEKHYPNEEESPRPYNINSSLINSIIRKKEKNYINGKSVNESSVDIKGMMYH